MMDIDKERQEFEKWWSDIHTDHKLNRRQTMGGDLAMDYKDSRVQYAFEAWIERARKCGAMMGEPCGEDAGLAEIAGWAGALIMDGDAGISAAQMSMLREIGEYLHDENPNEEQRKYALERYFALYDSVTGGDS